MSFRESVEPFLIGAAIGAGVGYAVGKMTVTDTGGGDDEPIIVGGGSLYFLVHGHKFHDDPNNQRGNYLLHDNGNKYVSSVDVIYDNNGQLTLATLPGRPNDQVTNVAIALGSGDTINFDTNAGQHLKLSNSDPNHSVKDDFDSHPSADLILHQSNPISSVTVKLNGNEGQTYTPTSGKCIVIIHHCSKKNCN